MTSETIEEVPSKRCAETERRLAVANDRIRELEADIAGRASNFVVLRLASDAISKDRDELRDRLAAADDRIRNLESRGRDYDRIVEAGLATTLELARKLAAAEDERDRFAALLEEARAHGSDSR